MDNDEFSRKLLEAFAIEADEHLKAITAGILELEKAPAGDRQKELIETTFREAHSLKGAARAVNRPDVESVCQALEGVLALWKRQPRQMLAGDFDVLNSAIDAISRQLTVPAFSEGHEGRQEARTVISKLRLLETGPGTRRDEPKPSVPVPAPSAPPAPPRQPEPEPAAAESVHLAGTVRVPVAKLNSLLRKAEGMIGVKLASRRYVTELREVGALLDTWRDEWQQARHLAGAPGADTASATAHLEWSREFMGKFDATLRTLAKNIEVDERAVSSAVDDMLDDAKKLLLMPFGMLLDIFPKQLRDLSREQGKEVDLVLRGREVEIDKRILDELKDVFVHLLRNAVDHGFEKPAVRTARGKPARGTLLIAVTRRDGNRIAIEISDDGGGIDVEKVIASAIRHGAISGADAGQLGRESAMALVFQSGVSTAPIVTDLSGRGLGMAIVREKIERLGGQIAIESESGKRTAFRIVLPVTLATFKGLVVSASGQTFVIPSSGIEQIARGARESFLSVENRPAIKLGGRLVPVAHLAEMLGLPGAKLPPKSGMLELVVLGTGDKRVAAVVDEIVTEQEVLVKPLARPLVRVRNVSSAAILGSGTPVIILNVADLIKSASRISPGGFAGMAGKQEVAPMQRVLVADDSVTSRMLLKNIMEAAGYHVTTAVDGVEALATLRRESFDILVSDVEMPRMSGFELTTKVRADGRLGELPVVLVTALGSREDRDRGIEAGANAYIVKSSFDQNNLIEIVRSLIA